MMLGILEKDNWEELGDEGNEKERGEEQNRRRKIEV